MTLGSYVKLLRIGPMARNMNFFSLYLLYYQIGWPLVPLLLLFNGGYSYLQQCLSKVCR